MIQTNLRESNLTLTLAIYLSIYLSIYNSCNEYIYTSRPNWKQKKNKLLQVSAANK
ncbi:hypothetical protein ACE6H2_008704 [Prunus campanulata]